MVGDTPELARGFGVAVAWLLFSCLNPRTGGGGGNLVHPTHEDRRRTN